MKKSLYLKSLAIRGFKSFARKTVLEFEPGVTIIVGPNGSGKSNIADAVMWVLGEQSPTSLRGNRMEDVIFSGSVSHKPVSIAEVVLTLDNEKNDFPLEYSEVTIARNVIRGGDSEYRLNNGCCRLLDIQELLSDSGVGRTLNSVVSQGQLDEVLSCRPEQRRDYIEEAGGLLKFRRRREKALRRLDRMDDELLRINDVLREVKRQLRPLRRQANRLERYQDLRRELSEARLRLDVARLRVMQGEWRAHQEYQRERRERLDRLEQELAGLKSEVEGLETGEREWREREVELRQGLYRLVSLDERLKAIFPVWGERLRSKGNTGAAEPVSAEPETLKHRREDLRRRKQEIENLLVDLNSEEEERAGELRGLRSRHGQAAREVMRLEAKLEVLERKKGTDEARVGRIDAWNRYIEEDERARGECEKEIADSSREISDERERLGGLEGQLASVTEEKAEMLKRLRDLERDVSQYVVRLEILTRLDTRSWTVLNTAGELMKNDPTGGGLGGMLIESLKIDEQYAKAITCFLGPWAYGLIARDSEAIKQAMEHLKEQRLGQSAFLRYAGDNTTEHVGRGPKISGARAALEAVEAPPWFADAVSSLLDSVYLVENLDRAFDLADEYPELIFLTEEGDAISGGTLMKGGSLHVDNAHLDMNRSRRLELEDALDSARRKMEEVELRLSECDSRGREIAEEIDKARARIGELQRILVEKEKEKSAAEARISTIRREVESAGAAFQEGGPSGFEDIEGLNERLNELVEVEKGLRGEVEKAEGDLEKILGRVRDAESVAAGVSGELDAMEEAGYRVLSARFPVEERGFDEEEIRRLKELHRRLQSLVSASRKWSIEELDRGAERVDETSGKIKALRQKINETQAVYGELREDMHSEDLDRTELKLNVEQLVQRIVDEHEVPLEFALKKYPDEQPGEELEAKVTSLSQEMEHIGPVNPEAITEKDALEERYGFLKGELDDVEKAKEQLRRVVKQVDREIKERFKETLTEVNKHFQEIFSFLFPKGRAELRLTDPDDLLGTGVEIYAQPEGKRLRRISLLSGGETSMTAIAFFFALFKVRPSPFYFLDEVEAALDDVNLHRFLDLVKQFRGESQLILITHQKRSMEIADILYGVSMQDDGVSKVVSQRIAS